jgi:uncharacterized protein (TIGR03000 family)
LWGQVATRRATLIVYLPADAQLEVEGKKIQKTGEVRRFVSPPLEVDESYRYTLRATWKKDGQQLEAEREISFRAGQTVEVDLRRPDNLPEPAADKPRSLLPEPRKLAKGEPGRRSAPDELRLLLPPDGVILEPGTKQTIRVHIRRNEVEGPVTVKFEDPSQGVQIPEATIPAGKEGVSLEVTAGKDAEMGYKEIRVIGTAGRVRAESHLPVLVTHPAEVHMLKGQFAQGEAALMERLKASPKDDQTRFGLGILQFIRAIEHLGQSLYRYGLRSDRGQQLNIPFLRLPVPTNPKPEACTYRALRQVFDDLIADLKKAEATLADIRDEQVKLPLQLGLIRLDLAGDGKSTDRFHTLLTRYLGGGRNRLREAELIVFDRGDVAWLRGYCHLLTALAEVFLAYDHQELFDCTGFLFFAKAESPHKFLTTLPDAPNNFLNIGGVDFLDIISFIHLIRFPVKEPERMKAALAHLEKCLALSKESWRFILAEKDDDHEWIPNPRQKGVLGIRVDQKMVESWLEFIDEAEAVLSGKRLIPLWRGNEERGINLRRVFTEPRTFDLVLWVQGTAATPYLEKGSLTKPAVWARLQSVFGGEFIGFAIWFN